MMSEDEKNLKLTGINIVSSNVRVTQTCIYYQHLWKIFSIKRYCHFIHKEIRQVKELGTSKNGGKITYLKVSASALTSILSISLEIKVFKRDV